MRKTMIYLPEDLEQSVKAKAQRTGLPVSELIREALRTSLRYQAPGVPRSIGAGAGGTFRAADDEAVLERE